jgi:hypothetical protein
MRKTRSTSPSIVSVRSAPSVTDQFMRCSGWGRCADQDGGESTTRRKTLAASFC